MALPALVTWEATRDALHETALVLGAVTTIRLFSRKNKYNARLKEDWRARVCEFKRRVDRFGIELGKACVYRLNYVIVVASADSSVAKPRE